MGQEGWSCMRAPSLRVKVTVAIVASLILIATASVAVAQYNFRGSAQDHAREEAQSRVRSLAHVLDLRFHRLGQVASDTAEEYEDVDAEKRSVDLRRAGFTAFVVVDDQNVVLERGGDAATNATLAATMVGVVPQAGIPGRALQVRDGWLVTAVRGLSQYGVVGAIDRETLTNSFLVDALIEGTDANVVATRNGDLVAASLTFPAGAPAPGSDPWWSFGEESYVAETAALTAIEGRVTHLVPASSIDAQVAPLVDRFASASVAAIAISGIVTLFVVTTSLRPLAQITDAARRLGRGEMDLDLHVRSRDEMGVLAQTLTSSAAAIARANGSFEVAVGGLARSVGEAETAPEIARRLGDAILHVAPVRAVIIAKGGEPLAQACAPGDDVATRALLQSDPDAFRWWTLSADDQALQVAVLPKPGGAYGEGDERKTEILVAQASLALHRARSIEKLDSLLRQKQVFVDILSHDLKNPIAVARGRIEIACHKHPELADRLGPAEASLDRATRIIEEAVLFSKLEAFTQIERSTLDMAALASDAASCLAPLAQQHGITIEVSAPARLPFPANALLARSIENLLSNAIKWSPQGAAVHLRVEEDTDGCRILIADHGPGIPKEDQARLFARFERADRTGVKGTGLGLAIAKRVVDVHAGDILIEETPGGGATFVLHIPRPRAETLEVDA